MSASTTQDNRNSNRLPIADAGSGKSSAWTCSSESLLIVLPKTSTSMPIVASDAVIPGTAIWLA